MLYFNSDKYDFWKIYEAISKFYPIGVNRETGSFFRSYEGMKELEAIIVDNIHNEKHFNERWVSFSQKIEALTKKKITGTTFGQAPSFSASLLIESETMNSLARTKEIHFFVTLVGPFYTIVGEDSNVVKVEKMNFRSTNYLVVSPEYEFADLFITLSDSIEEHFQGFKFVPFDICRRAIEGLQVLYSDENCKTVFHALFNNHIQINIANILGNSYYKADDWIKDGYVDDGSFWVAYPPEK